MVIRVKSDIGKEIIDTYEEKRRGFKGVSVETIDGIVYWFPYLEKPDCIKANSNYLIGFKDENISLIIHEKSNKNEYYYQSSIEIPYNVVKKAENYSGYPSLRTINN